MAAKQEALERLRKEVECSFCCDTMKEPKTLECCHNFCLECLNKYATRRRREGCTAFNCPECLRTFPLPKDDRFDGFLPAFQINRLTDIIASMEPGVRASSASRVNCEDCGVNKRMVFCIECEVCLCRPCIDKHNRCEGTRVHVSVPLKGSSLNVPALKGSSLNVPALEGSSLNVPALEGSSLNVPALEGSSRTIRRKESAVAFCAQHGKKEPLKFYCKDCKTCICKKCRRGKHRNHRTVDIEYIPRDLLKAEISQAMDKMRARLSECQADFEAQEKDVSESLNQIQSSREKLQSQVEELVQIVRTHETNVANELDELQQRQEEARRCYKSEYELISVQLKTYTDQATDALETGDDAEIVQAHNAVTSDQCAGLTASHSKISDGDNRLRVEYSPQKESSDAVRGLSFGRLNRFRRTDPSRCAAEGRGLREVNWPFVVGWFKVHTRDGEGNPSHWSDDEITIDTTTDSGQELLGSQYSIVDRKDGTYAVDNSMERWTSDLDHVNVSVKVNGHRLAGSPHRVQVSTSWLVCAGLMILCFLFLLIVFNPEQARHTSHSSSHS